MKKIGILTFHRAINHGASLQTFALMTILNKEKIFEVFQIDLEEPYITNGSKLINIRKENLIRSTIGTMVRFPASLIRNFKFKKFWERYLNFSEKYSDKIGFFDYYIVGSDQVWNFDIIGNDLNFLLDIDVDRTKIRKISYAASIGKSSLNEVEEKNFIKYLSDFDSISVREKSAQNSLAKINIKSEVVLDPTLLLSDEEWFGELEITSKKTDEFILVYTLEENPQINNAVDFYKKHLDITKVIYISSSINLHKMSNTYDPKEFIALFKNASFIITNSFHGTAFSVNFKKRFATIPHKTRSARMVDFLTLVNLETQIINSEKDFSYALKIIDYEKVNKVLDFERQKSIEYLRESLR
ncbi:polysaccharide pyruvyl transferase family protein [Vagococcus fluvialis]|uniref:polysaccharide pyruvyl transferase family protein n=1 Tax=Vagococcus fluvialis TaxID=2738 RepID=UPI0037D1C2A2